jgi:K+-sensing histidine kinase KdpD
MTRGRSSLTSVAQRVQTEDMTNSAPSASSATGSIDTPIQVERIVVGVDGSHGSQTALRWALREAQLRGVSVHAVFAWQSHQN